MSSVHVYSPLNEVFFSELTDKRALQFEFLAMCISHLGRMFLVCVYVKTICFCGKTDDHKHRNLRKDG